MLLALLVLVSIKLSAQSFERIEEEVLLLTKSNGDTVEIRAQAKTNVTDTVLLTVNSIKNKKRRNLQKFKTVATFPLELKATSFDNKKGMLVTYDPADKWGNAFLYLFDEAKSRFQEVKGFRELGLIEPVVNNRHQFFYSYISCGCADNCWVSKLFTVKQYKLYILAELSCDCSKLIAKSKKAAVARSCEAYNNEQKFENIAKYWRTEIKKGL